LLVFVRQHKRCGLPIRFGYQVELFPAGGEPDRGAFLPGADRVDPHQRIPLHAQDFRPPVGGLPEREAQRPAEIGQPAGDILVIPPEKLFLPRGERETVDIVEILPPFVEPDDDIARRGDRGEWR
jgi:hypothetical protein